MSPRLNALICVRRPASGGNALTAVLSLPNASPRKVADIIGSALSTGRSEHSFEGQSAVVLAGSEGVLRLVLTAPDLRLLGYDLRLSEALQLDDALVEFTEAPAEAPS
jgi:hypothetical protein